MSSLFFDSYVIIGPRAHKHPVHAWKLEDVINEMEHCSISGALVTHQLCVQYDAMYGNMKLLEEIKNHSNLFPLWNVIPHHNGEFPEPEKLIEIMNENQVRAVSLYPRSNSWSLLSKLNSELLKTLEKYKILTLIRVTELSFEELEKLLEQYPSLPLLLTEARWNEQRYIIPLLKRFKNLHINFSHFQCHYAIENLTELGLGEQLIYGSNAPLMSMGAHRTYIDYADVPDDVKMMIASGNLKRLLNQGPEENYRNPSEDNIMRLAREGKPQETPLYDMHIHMLHEGLEGAGASLVMNKGGPKGTLALMKRLGYDGGGIMSWTVVIGDAQNGNELVKDVIDKFPKGYWALGSFDPTHYKREEMQSMIEEFYNSNRFIGMKPYVVYGLRYDDPMYDPWWEFGNQKGFYALIHRTANDFSELDSLAPRFPNITWVVAHCGSDYSTADMAIACAKKNPNVCLEITLTPVTFGIIDYLVESVGADRVVYGSDLPMRDPRQQLGWVIYSRMSEEDKAKVLGGNALRIVKKCGWEVEKNK